MSAGAPSPTATKDGPVGEGTASVWPGLASNPNSVRRALDSPSWRGTGPVDATGTPMTFTSPRGACPDLDGQPW